MVHAAQKQPIAQMKMIIIAQSSISEEDISGESKNQEKYGPHDYHFL